MTVGPYSEPERLWQRLTELRILREQRTDALENVRPEDELKDLLDEYAQLQAQQIHHEKMAALGRLVASLAHEINNPLQSVLGCLSLAEEELNSFQRKEKLERYVSVAKCEVERICELVIRMREFYRPASRDMQKIDLCEALESVLELVHQQLRQNRVVVKREWPDTPVVVQANPGNLKQVFLNLVLNALDAMPSGGVLRVSVKTDQKLLELDNQPHAAVLIEFSDTGKGIPSEDLQRLFEPFFTTKEQGSGLGLYVSYGIIHSHNGKMTVTSQVGEGSTFSILLPREQPPKTTL